MLGNSPLSAWKVPIRLKPHADGASPQPTRSGRVRHFLLRNGTWIGITLSTAIAYCVNQIDQSPTWIAPTALLTALAAIVATILFVETRKKSPLKERISRSVSRLGYAVLDELRKLDEETVGGAARTLHKLTRDLKVRWELSDLTPPSRRRITYTDETFDPVKLLNATGGRMVLVGESGVGKTRQLHLTIEAILASKSEHEITPTLLDASSFSPNMSLARWIVTRTAERFSVDEGSIRSSLEDGTLAVFIDELEELPPSCLAALLAQIDSYLRENRELVVILAAQTHTLELVETHPSGLTYVRLLPPSKASISTFLYQTANHKVLAEAIERSDDPWDPLLLNAAILAHSDGHRDKEIPNDLDSDRLLQDWIVDALDRVGFDLNPLSSTSNDSSKNAREAFQWLHFVAREMVGRRDYFFMPGAFPLSVIDQRRKRILALSLLVTGIGAALVGGTIAWLITASSLVASLASALLTGLDAALVLTIWRFLQSFPMTSESAEYISPTKRVIGIDPDRTTNEVWMGGSVVVSALACSSYIVVKYLEVGASSYFLAAVPLVCAFGVIYFLHVFTRTEIDWKSSDRPVIDTNFSTYAHPALFVFAAIFGMLIALIVKVLLELAAVRYWYLPLVPRWVDSVILSIAEFFNMGSLASALGGTSFWWVLAVGLLFGVAMSYVVLAVVGVGLWWNQEAMVAVSRQLGIAQDFMLLDELYDSLRKQSLLQQAGAQYRFSHERIRDAFSQETLHSRF